MAKSHDGYRWKDGKSFCWSKMVNGKRWTVQAPTHREREERVRAKKIEIERGKPADPQTVKAHFDSWLALTVKPNRAYQTGQAYGYMISSYIEPAVGNMKMHAVKTGDLQKLLNDLTAKGVAPRTVKKVLLVLRLGFGAARAEGLVSFNPTATLTSPAPVESEKRTLTKDEVQRLIGYDRTRYAPLFAFLLSTGLRISEALGLRPQDITGDRILVSHQLSWRTEGEYKIEALKTKASKRAVPLSHVSRDALTRALEQRAQDEILAQDGWNNCGLIFTTESGSPVTPSNVYRTLASVLDDLKIPPACVHDLRRTFLTHLARVELRPQVLAAIAGHTNIQTTLQYYVVSMADDELSAVNKAMELFA